MRKFFIPTLSKIILLLLFLAIAVVGSLQASAFSEEQARVSGLWSRIPIWPAWMFLLAPLGLIFLLMDKLGLQLQQKIFGGTDVIFWSVQVVYFYVMACILVSAFAALRRKREAA